MFAGLNQILSHFTGRKKRKAWNNTREKYMSEERRQNLAKRDRGSYYNQEEWLEEFLDDKGAFCSGSESDDGDNDDENYNENMACNFIKSRCFPMKLANFLKTPFLQNISGGCF